MMLAEIMPDKVDLIMREASEFAVNRTVTRFHWTSDTIFGRVLGSVANAMCHATTDYATLLKIAKKEI
jgi:membrane-associated phospholipid phosphatase